MVTNTDHRMVFLDIYVGAPGQVHDARVFHNSDVFQRINDENHRLLDGEHHIIGDTAYPLLRNLMTPFRDNGHLTREEINYNMKLSSVRSVIERAYGRLKGKFRRLKYLDVASAEFGTQIIAAACVLHNYILINNDEEEAEEFEGNYDENVGAEDFDDDNPNVAVQKRRNIVNILNN
ncbi:DDE superfamily endonuclease [Popillia japonica]|uniref:DDE superfamily endonuclease n=1 Tax=Popillia japonica TaxID=7064 RepID=A0AAW1KMV6_POPJA